MNFIKIWKQYRLIQLAEKEKSKYLKSVYKDLNSLEVNVLNEILTKGFSIVENYYSPDECQKLIAVIDEIIAKYKDSYVWQDSLKSDSRIYGCEKIREEFRSFSEDKFLKRVGESFLGYYLTSSHVLAGRIKFKVGNLGSGQGWHRDTSNPFQFKAIIYLSDVSSENGPFEYLLGSHTKRSLMAGVINFNIEPGQTRFSESEIENMVISGKYSRRALTAKAGTLILVNTYGIHRGLPVKDGNRYALTNYFVETEKYDQEVMKRKYNLPS